MKVTLVMVQSVNGKITRGDDSNIYNWTSKEDQDFFFSFLQQFELIVMGSKTYEAASENIKLDDKRLRVVLTGNPEKYKDEEIFGKIEFFNSTPIKLLKGLTKRGYKKLLLVGGAEVNASFFASKLVNEVYLTLEPVIFGKGKSFVSERDLGLSLKLLEIKQLNTKGTLLLHYLVEGNSPFR